MNRLFTTAQKEGVVGVIVCIMQSVICGAVDGAYICDQVRIKDGLYRDTRTPSIYYTKGWFGTWKQISY